MQCFKHLSDPKRLAHSTSDKTQRHPISCTIDYTVYFFAPNTACRGLLKRFLINTCIIKILLLI